VPAIIPEVFTVQLGELRYPTVQLGELRYPSNSNATL